LKALKIFSFVFISLLGSASVQALELSAYGGPLGHATLGGCCRSSGNKIGGGLLGRITLSATGEIELLAFSNGRWSEGQILKPFYILGGSTTMDVGAGDLVEAKALHDWRWITSFGGGYFSHTTRTQKFDLPVLVTGLVFSAFNQVLYSIDDKWSAGGILQVSVGMSASDQSFLVGTFLTAAYAF
jgi:hypothetical protein